ncbi:GAF domain-containing protein [Sphingomonas ginkgonis]|uniref:GAF domain-containing protein n=1 Tax=Sphingomonas ginkgonis TaxID=2315330 RepID=A0A3R9X6K3_9SPHN|nr:GAF domain-containing protein [Sphingomonas ginkgonis]RST30057.1 GAF domain-containing protein [Sphingomonas ginkgonis]
MNESSKPICASDVVITADLDRRPSRAPDYQAENDTLRILAAALASRPDEVLQCLVERTMALTGAESVGVSLLEPGGQNGMFRWVAATGAWAPYRNGTMPREASPCGEVISRNALVLIKEPERAFPALRQASPPVHEGLLAPFHVDGEPIGTVWVIKHRADGCFDREDARLLQSLTSFATAAYQMSAALKGEQAGRFASEENYRTLFDSIDEGFAEIDLITDEQGRVVDWRCLKLNPALTRLTGMADVTGQRISEILPDLEPIWAERYTQLLRTGEPIRFGICRVDRLVARRLCRARRRSRQPPGGSRLQQHHRAQASRGSPAGERGAAGDPAEPH